MESWTDAYSGDTSFLRCERAEEPTGVDISVIGIPYDMGTTGRPGARFGPRAVREQSLAVGEFPWGVWPWDHDVRDRHSIRDLGDVMGFTAYPDRLCPTVEARADQILEAGSSLFSIGGDHFVSFPLLRAHVRKYGPVALIHFDAHSDTWVDNDLNHGTMFWHAIKEGLIDTERSVHIGLRTPNPDSHGILNLNANICLTTPAEQIAEQVRKRVGNAAAYLTFDIDFLDPAFAPATGTPVTGGPDVGYARRVLHGLKGLNIVGGDQVEVSPHYEGPGQITALAGATVAADIVYLIGLAREARFK